MGKLLARLADRLVLQPSRDPLPREDKMVVRFAYRQGEVEVLTLRADPTLEPQAYILKFGGAGSRAELAGLHPAEVWPKLHAEVWAVNYPGYGNSSGRASLATLAETTLLVYEQLAQRAGNRPIIVTGNSLGTACALLLAAQVRVDALLLRNPPPLRQLIVGRFGWWNLWLGASLIAQQVPRELDSLANAALAKTPCVFVMSGQDRIVPPRYQRRIIDAYAGPKRIVLDPTADHGTPLAQELEPEYHAALCWVAEQLVRS